MHTALRPYMTTGIAIVGASVIAAAPITVPPPDLPAVEIAAADAVKSVTADVDLTSLTDALVAAIGQSVANSVHYFANIPVGALNLLATGQFAHLPLLAVTTPFNAIEVPLDPFIFALEAELPLPLGTADGIIALLHSFYDSADFTFYRLADTYASVLEGRLPLGDAITLTTEFINVWAQELPFAVSRFIQTLFGAGPVADLATPLNAAEAGQIEQLAAFNPASFGQALVGAAGKALIDLGNLYLYTLPQSVGQLLSGGDFATLALIPAALAYVTAMTPVLPFVDVAMTELPFPLGGQYGVLTMAPVLAGLPVQVALDSLAQVAAVIDGNLAPADLVPGVAGVIGTGITGAVSSVTGFISTLLGALPGAIMAQEELTGARTLAAYTEIAADGPSDPNVVPLSVNSGDGEPVVDTVTVTVDPPADEGGGVVTPEPQEDEPAAPEPTDEEPAGGTESDDETPNGGTDLSDGNPVEPDTTGDESTSEDPTDSDVTEVAPSADGDSGEQDGSADDGDTGDGAGTGDSAE